MKDNLDKIIDSAKLASLHPEEKATIRASLLHKINTTPVRSPFWSFAFVKSHHYVPAFLLLFVFLSGGTSYFAQNSIPGDMLYSMKLNVNENLESFLASTPEDLAEISAIQANRRIIEAEILAQNDLLTPERNVEIQTMFSRKFDLFNESLAKIESDDSESEPVVATFSMEADSSRSSKSAKVEDSPKKKRASEIRAKFETELNDREIALQKLLDKSSTSTAGNILSFLKSKRGRGDDSSIATMMMSASVSDDSEDSYDDSDGRKEDDDDDESDDDDSDDDSDDDKSSSSNSVPTTQTTVTKPTASSTTTSNAVKTFTLAEVAQHKTVSSCYTVVRGNVYDVTAWISKHPGGESAIKAMCGVDATSQFVDQHTGQSRPESELAKYKIGVIK